MNKIKTSADIDHLRRRFFGAIAMTFAAAQFGMIGSANAQAIKASAKELPVVKPGTHTSFGPLKQIDAGLLNVGYAEAGPANGPAVILLHGWPYDIYSYVDVAPLLAAAGYRVIVPYLRGYGTTRFLSNDTFRNGQQSVVALDVIALMDALKIEKAILAGFDWGARIGRHHRGAVAGALQGAGLGERLSDRQPGSRQDAAAAGGRTAMVVPILFRHRTRPGRLRQIPARLLPSSSGRSLRRSGTSMTPRSIAPRHPSTIRTMLRS